MKDSGRNAQNYTTKCIVKLGFVKRQSRCAANGKKNAFRCFTSANSNSQLIISRSTCTLVRARSQSSACLSLPLTHACFRDLGNSNEKCRKM